MKLRIDHINQPIQLKITGSEDWLAPIYAGFSTPDGGRPATISGTIQVERETDELFKVSGHLDFVPWVDCSRCGDAIQWNTSGKFSYRAIPQEMDEVEDGSGERSFVYPDEEVLTYVGGHIDVAELVNDQIQLAIPLQTINRTESGKDCRDCGRSLEEIEIFKDPKDVGDTQRPFEVLKKLKI